MCQKCLTWQYAKHQLESSQARDDEETNELIMDLFLLNDNFNSAKYLIRKLSLGPKLQFKLDFGHLKYRLLNLNMSSSIIVIDLDVILSECVEFAAGNEVKTETDEKGSTSDYVFDVCYKLLNELKTLNELNNQVLVSLSEYILTKYASNLSQEQTDELKTIQVTAEIFQILLTEPCIKESFDTYKRHHSDPLLILEQLLMNSHIDLCSRAVQICRDSMTHDPTLLDNINKTLAKYARKALEFKVYKSGHATCSSGSQSEFVASSKFDAISHRKSSPTTNMAIGSARKKVTSSISIASSPNNLSTSFKSFHKLASHSYTNSANFSSFSYNTPPPTSFLHAQSHVHNQRYIKAPKRGYRRCDLTIRPFISFNRTIDANFSGKKVRFFVTTEPFKGSIVPK